jgi:DNA-directed RNA polymerase subunit N (RpoN/RPB10)
LSHGILLQAIVYPNYTPIVPHTPLPYHSVPYPTNTPTSSDALDAVGLQRYCCRRMILTHVDLIEKLLKYVPSGDRDRVQRETTEREKLRRAADARRS